MTDVLVVDDSLTLRQLIRAILEPAGYVVTEATDGKEGLAALREAAAPLVVLLDYQMPNMDGMEVLQAVVDAGGPLLAHDFIVISANQATFPDVFIDLLRHLSIRVLAKPFDREVLLSAVGQAAERLASPTDSVIPPEDDSNTQ
jgi:CheY-like chemotaxis protein